MSASWCSAPTKILQNIRGRQAEQPLLNRRGCKQLIFKNVCICKMFCGMLQSALRKRCVDPVDLTKALYVYIIYVITRCMYNTALHTYINLCTYVHPPWNSLHIKCSWSVYGPDFKVCKWVMRADGALRIVHASALVTRKIHE
jgi:hypothetical protein